MVWIILNYLIKYNFIERMDFYKKHLEIFRNCSPYKINLPITPYLTFTQNLRIYFYLENKMLRFQIFSQGSFIPLNNIIFTILLYRKPLTVNNFEILYYSLQSAIT